MNASPTRAGTAQRDSILAQQQQQQQQQLYTSWKRESPGRQGIGSSIGGGRASLSVGARKVGGLTDWVTDLTKRFPRLPLILAAALPQHSSSAVTCSRAVSRALHHEAYQV